MKITNLNVLDQGPQVTILKKILQQAGYPLKDTSDVFDMGTSGVLKAFQNDNRLPITGRLDSETVNFLNRMLPDAAPQNDLTDAQAEDEIMQFLPLDLPQDTDMSGAGYSSRPTLRQGDNGSYVIQLQDALDRLQYLSAVPDGFFGNQTAAAVRKFQQDKGLTADAIVGAQTWSALDNALSSLTNTSGRPTLRIGSSGVRVKELQLKLNTLGYNVGSPDGVFGAQTDRAVKEFQARYGLSADGIVGTKTWDALDNAFSANPQPPTTTPTTTIRQGDSGSEVSLLQEKLRVLGFYSGTVDGLFGPATTQSVKAFQSAYGLNPDGIVGSITWAKLDEATSINSNVRRVIRQGDTGDDVTILQEKLKELGYFAASITGSFGAETTQSVKAFQKNNGLTADGIVGARTWAVLFANTTSPLPPSTPGESSRPTLRLGDVGSDVVDLQSELQRLMFYSGAITGVFDQATQVAVKSFQDVNRLTPDGIVGRSTWNALIILFPPLVVCL